MQYSIIDEYVTSSEDTIYRIAMKFYFKWYLWRIVYDPNKEVLGDDPYSIPAGKKIRIIGINTAPINHTIREDDTYHRLANEYYGSEMLFVNIGKENEYKHLIPGEIAIVPALVTEKDLQNARYLRDVCS